MDPAPMEKAGVDEPKEVPTPPKPEAGVLGVLKERVLLPLPTAPGTGVPCPKVGTEGPPNAGLLLGVLVMVKAKGVLWPCTPSALCGRDEPKGAAAGAAPLCPAPKLKATAGDPLLRPGVPIPKALVEGPGWVLAPKVNGDGVVPKTLALVLLLVVWVVAPKLDVVEVAVPKENTEVVVPNAAWVLLVPKEPWALVVPKAGWAPLPNAG